VSGVYTERQVCKPVCVSVCKPSLPNTLYSNERPDTLQTAVVILIAGAFTHRARRLSDHKNQHKNQTCLILAIGATTGLQTGMDTVMGVDFYSTLGGPLIEAPVERRRRENGGAVGAEGVGCGRGFPLPTGGGV